MESNLRLAVPLFSTIWHPNLNRVTYVRSWRDVLPYCQVPTSCMLMWTWKSCTRLDEDGFAKKPRLTRSPFWFSSVPMYWTMSVYLFWTLGLGIHDPPHDSPLSQCTELCRSFFYWTLEGLGIRYSRTLRMWLPGSVDAKLCAVAENQNRSPVVRWEENCSPRYAVVGVGRLCARGLSVSRIRGRSEVD